MILVVYTNPTDPHGTIIDWMGGFRTELPLHIQPPGGRGGVDWALVFFLFPEGSMAWASASILGLNPEML